MAKEGIEVDGKDARVATYGGNVNLKVYLDRDKGGKLYMPTIAGSQHHKGLDDDIAYWFYDEFVPVRYATSVRMRTEYQLWEHLKQTLERTRRMRICMACNNLHWINPFFSQWRVYPFQPSPKARRYTAGGLRIAVEHIDIGQPGTPLHDRCMAEYMRSGHTPEEWAEHYQGKTRETTVAYTPIPAKLLPKCISGPVIRHAGKSYAWCVRRDTWSPVFSEVQAEPSVCVTYADVAPGLPVMRDLMDSYIKWYERGRLAFDSVSTHKAFVDMCNETRLRVLM